MKNKFLAVALAIPLIGCAATAPGPVDNRNSALTQGNVQLNLKMGQTTKANVLESDS